MGAFQSVSPIINRIETHQQQREGKLMSREEKMLIEMEFLTDSTEKICSALDICNKKPVKLFTFIIVI